MDPRETLTVTDNRTDKRYEIPINNQSIDATELRNIKLSPDDHGLMSYDPSLKNTATCTSRITYIDGDRGILLYRGYPIEELAEKSSFLETAYLLIHGELPNSQQIETWENEIKEHSLVHENVKHFMDGFHHDAHPMGMVLSTVGALSTFYPDSIQITDPEQRRLSIRRLIAKMPTLAAFAYRHNYGLPYIYPDNSLSYSGNFLSMMFRMVEPRYAALPEIERTLDMLFILHADHEQNCSTNAMRSVGSSRPDPYSTTAAAIAALYGPLHGGANEAVIRMLQRIGHISAVPEFIKGVKEGKERLMGFGHRIYKNYDPRARIIKQMLDRVIEITGSTPLLDIAVELERIALEDDYFTDRKLYPNVDYYVGLIYQAIGLPVEMFPVMFAIPRTVGWLAQWEESLLDQEQKIVRPLQIYAGHGQRSYVPISRRTRSN